MTRQATLSDIPRLVEIRGAVRENRLSDPGRVTLADYEWQIINGPTYVWDDGGLIKGMSVGDPRDGSIWALSSIQRSRAVGSDEFSSAQPAHRLLRPGHRIAKLSTDPGTRAERFYLRNGWRAQGYTERGEVIFVKEL